MYKRILTAVLGVPLLILIVKLGGIPLLTGVIVITSIGLYELYSTFQVKNSRINILFEIILSIILLIIMDQFPKFILLYITLLFFIHFMYQIFINKPSFEDGLLSFMGIYYVSFLLGHILLFDNILYGNYLIWLVFLIAFSTDTFAYFTGLYLGRKKLCPGISPKKTIEGSIGGVLGSLLVCILYGIYLNNLLDTNILSRHFIVLGVLTSIISQFGDLTASLIKRNYGIKDFGKIFPGHGGILDRFDSIIFAAPIVYYYISIFY